MTEHAIGNLIYCAVFVAILARLWFWEIRQYCVQRTRYKLFALRDELFNLAATGAIEFGHPAYGRLRTMLNGAIRFANSFTFLEVVIYGSSRTPEMEEARAAEQREWEAYLSQLPTDVRRKVSALHRKYIVVLFELAATTSLIPWAFGLPLVPVLVAVGAYKKARAMIGSWAVPRVEADMNFVAAKVGSSRRTIEISAAG